MKRLSANNTNFTFRDMTLIETFYKNEKVSMDLSAVHGHALQKGISVYECIKQISTLVRHDSCRSTACCVSSSNCRGWALFFLPGRISRQLSLMTDVGMSRDNCVLGETNCRRQFLLGPAPSCRAAALRPSPQPMYEWYALVLNSTGFAPYSSR